MAKSMLAAIRAALHAEAAELVPDIGEDGVPLGGRQDTQQEETQMSVNKGKPAAEILAGITDAAISEMAAEAVASARAEAGAEGAKAERERLSGILGAEGIKGDGKRMSAALDLAAKSPGMSAEDVAAFVTGNVAEASAEADPAGQYEASRTGATGLASPAQAPKAKSHVLNSGSIYQSRREQVRKD